MKTISDSTGLELLRYLARLVREETLINELADGDAREAETTKLVVEALHDDAADLRPLIQQVGGYSESLLWRGASELVLESFCQGPRCLPEIVGLAAALDLVSSCRDWGDESERFVGDKRYAVPIVFECCRRVGKAAPWLGLMFARWLVENDENPGFKAHYIALEAMFCSHIMLTEGNEFGTRYDHEAAAYKREELYYSASTDSHRVWSKVWEKLFTQQDADLNAVVKDISDAMRL